MLLRQWLVQPLSREEEELDHLDVGRKCAVMQRIRIREIRIAAEQAIDHRSDEAPFEQALRLRLFQRQCGEQRQIDGAVGQCPRIQRVDDVVSLAEAERQPDHQFGSDVTNDVLRDRLGVGEQYGHQQWTRRRQWITGVVESTASGSNLYFI
ncbi:hypothetical protein AB7M47_007298 [Bradyrhizobium elkanii]